MTDTTAAPAASTAAAQPAAPQYPLLAFLTTFLPTLGTAAAGYAAIKQHSDPTISTAPEQHIMAAAAIASTLVPQVNAVAAGIQAAAPAGSPPMTGAQKLDLFHSILASALTMVANVATGGLAGTIASFAPLIDVAVSGVCAAAHASDGTAPKSPTDWATFVK